MIPQTDNTELRYIPNAFMGCYPRLWGFVFVLVHGRFDASIIKISRELSRYFYSSCRGCITVMAKPQSNRRRKHNTKDLGFLSIYHSYSWPPKHARMRTCDLSGAEPAIMTLQFKSGMIKCATNQNIERHRFSNCSVTFLVDWYSIIVICLNILVTWDMSEWEGAAGPVERTSGGWSSKLTALR